MKWLVALLLAVGVVSTMTGAALMDRGPDWLSVPLARGGVVVAVAGLVLAVAVAVTS